MNKENLRLSLTKAVIAVRTDADEGELVSAATDVLCAFAEMIRGPVAVRTTTGPDGDLFGALVDVATAGALPLPIVKVGPLQGVSLFSASVALVREWLADAERGSDALGEPVCTPGRLIAGLTILAKAQ